MVFFMMSSEYIFLKIKKETWEDFQKVLSVGCLELICVVLALRMKVLPGLIIYNGTLF